MPQYNIPILICSVLALGFFTVGYNSNSAKYNAIGGTLLSIAMICLILLR